MSKSDIAVSVRNLSKSFMITQAAQATTAAEAVANAFRRERARPAAETFWALKDVSFDIKQGEVVGIIGRNGAGKSTLLKILARVAEPTKGRIDLYGRVGSLLEVGAGFHPELTGRENVYLNGAVLGLTRREIAARFDEIVDFSEVGPFLDTPVKRYSSGMYVRLAFSVAAYLDPDILIVDEALAVGDMQFQQKCLGKLQDVAQQQGRTVLFVSHQIAPIQKLCTCVMLFTSGHLAFHGPVNEGISRYMEQAAPAARLDGIDLRDRSGREGDGLARFTSLRVLHDDPTSRREFLMGERIGLRMTLTCDAAVPHVTIGYSVMDLFGGILLVSRHNDAMTLTDLAAGETTFESWIDPNYFQPGRYALQLHVIAGGTVRDAVPDVAQIEIVSIWSATTEKLDTRAGVVRIAFPWRQVAESEQGAEALLPFAEALDA